MALAHAQAAVHFPKLTDVDEAAERTMDDASATNSSSCSSTSPSKPRHRPPPLRLKSVGIEPGVLVGKTLKHVRRSPTHPSLTLDFADQTSYQVRVDGYNPRYRGVPKTLEMDSAAEPLFNPPQGHKAVDLVVKDCAFIRMSDKAFERREWESEHRWDQSHIAIAFKFGELKRWHCVWATLAEFNEEQDCCVFRSYDDVYLEPLVRTPRSPQNGRGPKRD